MAYGITNVFDQVRHIFDFIRNQNIVGKRNPFRVALRFVHERTKRYQRVDKRRSKKHMAGILGMEYATAEQAVNDP
jgi:hypothetical protein